MGLFFPGAYSLALWRRVQLLSDNGLVPGEICLALRVDSPDDVEGLPRGLNVEVVDGVLTVCKDANRLSIDEIVEHFPDEAFLPNYERYVPWNAAAYSG